MLLRRLGVAAFCLGGLTTGCAGEGGTVDVDAATPLSMDLCGDALACVGTCPSSLEGAGDVVELSALCDGLDTTRRPVAFCARFFDDFFEDFRTSAVICGPGGTGSAGRCSSCGCTVSGDGTTATCD